MPACMYVPICTYLDSSHSPGPLYEYIISNTPTGKLRSRRARMGSLGRVGSRRMRSMPQRRAKRTTLHKPLPAVRLSRQPSLQLERVPSQSTAAEAASARCAEGGGGRCCSVRFPPSGNEGTGAKARGRWAGRNVAHDSHLVIIGEALRRLPAPQEKENSYEVDGKYKEGKK